MREYIKDYSLLSVIIMIGASGLAVALIPKYSYYEYGALVTSGTILSLGLISALMISTSIKLDSIFRLEFIILFGVFFWLVLDAAQGAYSLWGGVSYEGIVRVYISAALFSVTVYVCARVVTSSLKTKVDVKELPISSSFIFIAVIFCFTVGMTRVFLSCDMSPLCIIEGLQAPRFESPWRNISVPGWNTLLVKITLFGYLVLPLAVLLHHIERRISWRVWVSVFLAFVFILVLLQGGGRRQIGIVLGMSVLVWVLLRRPVEWKRFLSMILVLAVTLVIMERMQEYRNRGFFSPPEEVIVEEINEKPALVSVDKNLFFFGHIASIVPERYPHTTWRGVYSVLAAPIPRSVLPNKPSYNVLPLTQYVPVKRSPGWSWTCSAVCELYLIGGYFVVFVGGLIFGLAAGVLNRLLDSPVTITKVLYYGVAAITIFVGLRALKEIMTFWLLALAFWGVLYFREIAIKRWKLSKLYKMRSN